MWKSDPKLYTSVIDRVADLLAEDIEIDPVEIGTEVVSIVTGSPVGGLDLRAIGEDARAAMLRENY